MDRREKFDAVVGDKESLVAVEPDQQFGGDVAEELWDRRRRKCDDAG